MSGGRRVRLLLVCAAQAWGGAEVFLGHLLEGLERLDAPVDAELMGVDADVLARIAARRPGTPTHLVPVVGSKRDVAAVLAQRRAMAAVRPDVVQVNLPVPFSAPYSVLAATTLRRAKVVAVEHLPVPWPSSRTRTLTRLTTGRVDAHVAVGSGTARAVEASLGLAAGSVLAVPNGVPVPVVRGPVPRPDGFVVVGVGRLHEQKGYDVLLRAAADLTDVQVVLVGDGPERGALERLAGDLGMADRLHVTGWTDRAADWLAAADVLALPSRWEGLPLVLLEAMHLGTPVVTTGVGSILDAVDDGRTGLVVPVDDADALAAALGRLRDDAGLRATLAGAAQERAGRDLGLERMAAGYAALYARLTGT